MGYDRMTGISVKCPNCGKDVDDFQTKDGPNSFLDLKPGLSFDIPKWDAHRSDKMVAYTFCNNCCTWIDLIFKLITVTRNKVMISTDFTMNSRETKGHRDIDKSWVEENK